MNSTEAQTGKSYPNSCKKGAYKDKRRPYLENCFQTKPQLLWKRRKFLLCTAKPAFKRIIWAIINAKILISF